MTKKIRIAKEHVESGHVTIDSNDKEYEISFRDADFMVYLNDAETMMVSHFGNKPEIEGIQSTICFQINYLFYIWRRAVRRVRRQSKNKS